MGKFDVRSDEGIFLGYSLNILAYRFYNLRTFTVMESINVVVDDGSLVDLIYSSEDDASCEIFQ